MSRVKKMLKILFMNRNSKLEKFRIKTKEKTLIQINKVKKVKLLETYKIGIVHHDHQKEVISKNKQKKINGMKSLKRKNMTTVSLCLERKSLQGKVLTLKKNQIIMMSYLFKNKMSQKKKRRKKIKKKRKRSLNQIMEAYQKAFKIKTRQEVLPVQVQKQQKTSQTGQVQAFVILIYWVVREILVVEVVTLLVLVIFQPQAIALFSEKKDLHYLLLPNLKIT